MTGAFRGDAHVAEKLIAAQRPGFSLQQRFYSDPDIYELELERVIARNWFLAGHVSEFANEGNFKVFRAGRDSAIVVRGTDGELRAFANVCRHRGSLVCLEQSGTTRKFVCPYHGWTYSTDGTLTAARDFPKDLAKSDFGLKPVALEIIHGLVLVCFNDQPPKLERCREELAAPMQMFGFENLKVAHQRDYPIDANWKLAVENYQECYHCAPAHPEYAARHTLMLDRKKRPRVQEAMRTRMEAAGVEDYYINRLDTAAEPGEIGYGYSRTALFDGYQTGSRDGQPLAPLLGELKDYDGGASDFSFGAFSFLLAYSDHIVSYVFTPLAHEQSNCRITWYVRGDAIEGKDYDVDELTWLWDVTTQADKTIIENNAQGVNSRFYEPGPFCDMEHAEQNWVEWYLGELGRAA